jgi:hypothetical protein
MIFTSVQRPASSIKTQIRHFDERKPSQCPKAQKTTSADKKFLAYAIIAAADFIITGNKWDFPPKFCKRSNRQRR